MELPITPAAATMAVAVAGVAAKAMVGAGEEALWAGALLLLLRLVAVWEVRKFIEEPELAK